MSATPEPTLMTVGMMLNFPAWSTERQGGVRKAAGQRDPPGLPQHAPPSQDLPSFRRGASPTHLAVHHHIKADPVGFKQRAELHPSCVSVILGKPGGDTAREPSAYLGLPCLATQAPLPWRFITPPPQDPGIQQAQERLETPLLT